MIRLKLVKVQMYWIMYYSVDLIREQIMDKTTIKGCHEEWIFYHNLDMYKHLINHGCSNIIRDQTTVKSLLYLFNVK